MDAGMNGSSKAFAICICVIIIFLFLIGFVCGVVYQINEQSRAEQEKIECVKDSLYNEYVTDKLNKQ